MRRHPSSSLSGSLPGWQPTLWIALLVAASVAFTLGFACAMPFAGLGAAAAMTLRRRDALVFAVAAWAANQAVGFCVLGYPDTADTIAWGGVFGVVAVLATLAAQAAAARTGTMGFLATALASFAAAFVVYEGGLYLVSATLLGGTEIYVAPIVERILAINACAFAGLLALHALGTAAGLAPRRVGVTPASP